MVNPGSLYYLALQYRKVKKYDAALNLLVPLRLAFGIIMTHSLM